MTKPLGDLKSQVEEFGQELAELFAVTLPNLPEPVVETLSSGPRHVVQAGVAGKGIPLFVSGTQLAVLKVDIRCRLDSVGQYLAVDESTFLVSANVDRTPILRFDYKRDMHTAPTAHVQVHAHRGALSHLLSRTGHAAPHDMSALHIPVGGSRFRPSIEDVIQFLIQECRFDSLPGWQSWVEEGRERWRRRQVAAATRDVPAEAARVLREIGYRVEAPDNLPTEPSKALRHW